MWCIEGFANAFFMTDLTVSFSQLLYGFFFVHIVNQDNTQLMPRHNLEKHT